MLGYLQREGSSLAEQPDRVREVAPIVQEKLRELSQFESFAGFLFGPVEMDAGAWAKVSQDPEAPRALAAAADALEALDSWDVESIEAALRSACEAVDLKPRVLFLPVRVAITGHTVSPACSRAWPCSAARNLSAGLEP